MTAKDKELIERAERVNYTEWYFIDDMIPEAQTEECVEILKAISRRKYHYEEMMCGCE